MRTDPWGAAGRSLKRPHLGGICERPGGTTLLLLAVFLLAVLLGATAHPARGAEGAPGHSPQEGEAVAGPVNFDRAVRLALHRSPYFTKSSLEIEIKRLDESDSRYDLLPPVTFRTQYYLSQPAEVRGRAYVLSFTSNSYNPVESYFTLKGREMITQIAVLAHLQVISEGIQKLGKMFLEMDALKQAAARQDDLINLARQNVAYFQNRLRIGTVTSLEIKVASRELEGAEAEKERIANSQNRLQENLKAFIGLKAGQPLELDCKEARRQVLGSFDAAAATLEQAQTHSYELKIVALKKQLQNYNIMMAKARLLPSLFFSAQSPDPLSLTQSRGLFFSVGVEVPVWDGFKRLRNISRQKTILKQFGADTDEKMIDLTGRWREALENIRAAHVSRKSAQTQEELARLKERQSEIRYQSGGEPLAVYLEGRKGLVEAQRNTFLKTLDYDLAVMRLRQLSGDLDASYVDASSWQQ